MAALRPTPIDARSRSIVDATTADISALAADWDPDERHILAAVFRALASGHPAGAADVASAADRPVADVEAVLEARGDQMQLDDDGRIIGWSGLTLTPTRHRVRHGDVTLYTWCALDPYFIAPILGRTLFVTSTDPVTDSVVEVTIHPDGRVEAPAGAAATLVSRGAERLAVDVIANFCDYVHHFPSVEVAERFSPDDVEPVVVGLDALAATGRALYEGVWRA